MKTINVYKLINPNPSPEMKELKKKFDKAVKNWNEAYDEFEAAPLKETRNSMEKLMKANKKISEIKQKIISISDS